MTNTNPCNGFINQCCDWCILLGCIIRQCSLTQMCEYASSCHPEAKAASVHQYGTGMNVLCFDMCMCAATTALHTSAYNCCDVDRNNQSGTCCHATASCIPSTTIHAQLQAPTRLGTTNTATSCSSRWSHNSMIYDE